MSAKISIIVPAYNVEKYIKKCISSIRAQTYDNIEIIIINDGSTDKTIDICNKEKTKDKRMRVFTQKNGGLSSARNTGIKKSRGDYLVFVDGDDYISPTMVETLYDDIIKNTADISICNRFYVSEDESKKWVRFKRNEKLILDKKNALVELMCMGHFDMSAWCKMYKKELFRDISFPIGRLCEDYYIMYKIFDLCDTITYSPTPLLYYVQRAGSISKKDKIIFDYICAAKNQMNYIMKKYKDLSVYAESAYALAFLTAYNKYLLYGKGDELRNIANDFKMQLATHKSSVYKNKKIGLSKKIGLYLFCHFTVLYNIIIRKHNGN